MSYLKMEKSGNSNKNEITKVLKYALGLLYRSAATNKEIP